MEKTIVSASSRRRRVGLLLTAAIVSLPVTIGMVATPALAEPGDESTQGDGFIWFNDSQDVGRQYYRSEMTGAIIPVRHTDPPYNPSDKSMKLLPRPPERGFSRQHQVLDEINFEAQQLADQWGVVRELRSHWLWGESSVVSKSTTDFGAVFTQSGTIAQEQREEWFGALVSRAESEARLVAIGKVFEKIKPQLTRAGLEHYMGLIEAEQTNIEVQDDVLGRMTKIQRDALAIDILSLGLARAGSYLGQVLNNARLARQVATQQAAAQAAERQAAAQAARTGVVEAESKAVASAIETRAAQRAANSANSAAARAGTQATQTEAAAVARQAEAKAAEEAVNSARQMVGRTSAHATGTKAAAESAEQAVVVAQREAQAAQRALTSAEADLARAATAEEAAAARTAVQQAQARMATAQTTLQSAQQEARAATNRAIAASADAASARAQLATAMQQESAARAALETARAEASQASAALSRTQTAANAASDEVAQAVANQTRAIARLAESMTQAEAAAGRELTAAVQAFDLANARLASATSSLASAGSDAARATAASKVAAAQNELARAGSNLAAAQEELAKLTTEAAKVKESLKLSNYFKDLFFKFRFSETSLADKFRSFLFDLNVAIIGNQTGSADLTVDQFGPALSEWRQKLLDFLAGLSPEEHAELDRLMENAPPDVKETHEGLQSETAPVDSSTSTEPDAAHGDGIAPLTSPVVPASGMDQLRTASPDGSGTAPVDSSSNSGDDAIVPSAPTELSPDTGAEGTSTGTSTEPEPKRRRNLRISQATGLWVDTDGGTAIAVGGLGFEFATSIPEISFEISPAPIEEAVPTYAMVDPEPTETGLMTDEQRAARLAAIEALRTGQADQSATAVQQPFGSPQRDPSRAVVADITRRRLDVERQMAMREHDRQDERSSEMPSDSASSIADGTVLTGTVAEVPVQGSVIEDAGQSGLLAPENPAVEVSKPVEEIAQSPSTHVAQVEVEEAGIEGTWVLQDSGSGVRQVSFARSGKGLVLTGLGGPILLEQDGNRYYGTGATLFGVGGHDIVIVDNGASLLLQASHPNGARWRTTLKR